MSGKRWVAIGVLATGICMFPHAARAEDEAPPKKEAAAAAPKDAPKKKDPFFGNHFAMYLETRGGPASIDAVRNPITSGTTSISDNVLRFNGNKMGQFTIGWTLPRGRGQYLLKYTGISDGDYELDGTGSQLSYVSTDGSNGALLYPIPWWQVTIRNGQLTTTKTPPVWNRTTDDANGNTIPDPEEIRYPATTVSLTDTVPSDLGNRIQTWDLAYRREFGGVRIRAQWEAGVRYLNVDGAILTPSWLVGAADPPGVDYSDGVLNKMLLIQQSTSGYGPMGSGEVDFNFFRQRLTLYAKVEAAFLITKLDADSGGFTYFARDTTGGTLPYPGPGHISRSIEKTAWNTKFEAGVKVKMLEGFHLIVDWNTTGYLDAILIPNTISIPVNAAEAPLGTSARFLTRDYVVSTINLGLSFQF